MIKANVILDHYKWKNKIKNPNNYLKKKIRKLSKIPYFKRKNQEFSILLTSNKKMKSLNLKFRKKNKPTNILSFPIKKMINKNFSKLFKNNLNIAKNLNLDLNQRPGELSNEMFYKIALQYEDLFG